MNNGPQGKRDFLLSGAFMGPPGAGRWEGARQSEQQGRAWEETGNLPSAACGRKGWLHDVGQSRAGRAVSQGKGCFRRDGLVAESHLYSEAIPVGSEGTSVGFPDHTCPVTAKKAEGNGSPATLPPASLTTSWKCT